MSHHPVRRRRSLKGLLTLSLLILAGVASSSGVTCTPPPSGQLLWLPGDGNANDLGASGSNGSLSNGATYATGKVGQAFSFDGIDDVLTLASPLNPGRQYTLDAWVNPSQLGGGYTDATLGTMTRRTAAGGVLDCIDWSIGLYGGKLGALYRTASSGSCNGATVGVLQSSITVSTGTWYHLALTSDGATARLYVNGQLQASGAAANYVPQSQFRVGGTACCAGDAFAGQIDEVEVHDRALTAGEIAAIYEAGIAGMCKTQACATPPPGLIRWYRGEGDAKDALGSNDGTLLGGVGFATGKVGQAFSLDGGDDYLSIPDSPDLEAGALTVQAWVYPTAGGSRRIFDKGEAGTADGFTVDTYNGLRVIMDTSDGHHAIGTGGLAGGAWSHLAMTYDGALIKLFVNGIQVGSTAATGLIDGNDLDLRIGAAHVGCGGGCGTSEFFGGLIDEVQVFGRALSATEIKEVYEAGTQGVCTSACTSAPTGLLALYKGENNALDSQGRYPGGLVNGVGFAAGHSGQAFSFDGVDDLVEGSDIPVGTRATLAAWIRPGVQSGPGHVSNGIERFTAVGGVEQLRDWSIGIYDGKIGALFKDTDGLIRAVKTIDSVPGTWYHVVATYNGSQVKVYVNGALQGSATTFANYDLTDYFKIGTSNCCRSSEAYTGLVDEVQVFSRALTAAQVTTIYQDGLTTTCAGGCSGGSIAFDQAEYSGSEATGKATVKLLRSGSTSGVLHVLLSTADDTAAVGDDYTALSSYSVTIPNGLTSKNVLLTNILNDSTDEPKEYFHLDLVSVDGQACIADTQPTTLIGIADDDPIPTLSFSASTVDADVAESAGSMTVGVVLSNPRSVDTRVTFSFGGEAVKNRDYSFNKDGGSPPQDITTVTIPAGQTTGSLSINVLDDSKDEADESLTVALKAGAGYVLADPGHPDLRTYGLIDNDPTPTVKIAGGGAMDEGMVKTIRLTLSAASGYDVSVPYRLSGTAQAGDYQIAASSPVLIPAGSTSVSFDVTAVDDPDHENTERVIVTLGTPTHADLGTPTSVTVTINAND